MRVTLVVLGWVVVALGAARTGHLVHLRLWARAAQVGSWVILSAGLSLIALLYNGPHAATWLRDLFAGGLLLGTAGLILQRIPRIHDDPATPED